MVSREALTKITETETSAKKITADSNIGVKNNGRKKNLGKNNGSPKFWEQSYASAAASAKLRGRRRTAFYRAIEFMYTQF